MIAVVPITAQLVLVLMAFVDGGVAFGLAALAFVLLLNGGIVKLCVREVLDSMPGAEERHVRWQCRQVRLRERDRLRRRARRSAPVHR